MLSFAYHGWTIHDNFTRGRTTYQCPDTHQVYEAKSVHSAKCLITRKRNAHRPG